MTDAEAIVRAWVDAINARDFDAFDTLFAPTYVNHHRPYAQDDGVPGVRRFFEALCDALDGFFYDVESLTVDGEHVRLRLRGTGVQVGEVLGMAPTNAPVEVTVTHLYRVTDGRIQERWGDPDDPFAIRPLEEAGA